MLNDKLKAARGIARALGPSEDTVDSSIIQNAQLLISIVEARLSTGVAAEVGHGAFLRASAGLASLAEARDHIVACHQELAGVRDDNGLSPRAVGCTLGKRDVFTDARGATGPTVVEAAA